MKWSWFGRAAMAMFSALALGLGMTACGGGTIAYLWVIGGQYDRITGYKVDHYTGNLTAIQHSPFSTNGSAPAYIIVKPGGRYVYVINQGTATTATANAQDAGVAEFAVGGDGALTYQETFYPQGIKHLWAQFDSTGNYLYVLDQYSPSGDGNGAITTFAADPNTGRLTLVTQSSETPSGGVAPNYLEVGQSPLRMATVSSCLFTINQTDQSITPYGVGTGGQLTTVTTGKIFPLTTRMTSINTNGSSYVMLTDAGPVSTNTAAANPGFIFPFTVSSGCSLTPFTTGAVANLSTVSNPGYAYIDASNTYVFVLNQSSTSTTATSPYSYVSEFQISAGQLIPLVSGGGPVGSGPVCMIEDPTHEYMYVSNQNDGTITGYDFSATQGTLSNLARGSTFQTNNLQTGCLALSASVD